MNRTEARRLIALTLDGVRASLGGEYSDYKKFIVEHTGSARFSSGELTLKIKLTDPAFAAENLRKRAHRVGGADRLLGKRFNCPTPGGKPRWHEVVDIHSRKPKFPVIAKNLNSGKLFKFSVAQVTRYLEA